MIYTTTFRLRAGTDEAQFVAADAAVQVGFAYQQSGLARRTTARADDGGWIVIEQWHDADRAEAAAMAGSRSPLVAAFAALIDPDSIETARYRPLD